MFIEDTLGGVA